MSLIVQQLADPAAWLVLAGGGLQASAHLFKNQIVLRMVLLAGSVHYIAYYFAVSDHPLWPAILATTAITMGCIFGLARAIGLRERLPPPARATADQAPTNGTASLRTVEN